MRRPSSSNSQGSGLGGIFFFVTPAFASPFFGARFLNRASVSLATLRLPGAAVARRGTDEAPEAARQRRRPRSAAATAVAMDARRGPPPSREPARAAAVAGANAVAVGGAATAADPTSAGPLLPGEAAAAIATAEGARTPLPSRTKASGDGIAAASQTGAAARS
mmetsp:Transcript_23269/g.62116  ORF Transcript_23269/g.62116 Transcript_23269/m.62116 type:complete len:164 (+) Transcript_23269:1165-1656(+)